MTIGIVPLCQLEDNLGRQLMAGKDISPTAAL
jgi:hypothetical protein